MSESLAVPSALTVGDSWAFTLGIPNYDRPTWTATLYLRSATAAYTVVSSGAGPDHAFSASAVATAAYAPGDYRWQMSVASGSTRLTIAEGWITLLPNPASTGNRDPRSWARRTLEAIEATLENRASNDQLTMQIRDRAIGRMPLPDLLKWRDDLRKEVRSEESAEKQGLGRNIKVRFQRP